MAAWSSVFQVLPEARHSSSLLRPPRTEPSSERTDLKEDYDPADPSARREERAPQRTK